MAGYGRFKIFLLPLCILLVALSAVSVMAQSFEQNNLINLKVSCGNINCTSPLITVQYPNTSILIDNKSMTSNPSFANYSFTPDTIGEYHYFIGNYEGLFSITKNGYDSEDNSFAIVFGLSMIALIFMYAATQWSAGQWMLKTMFIAMSLLSMTILGRVVTQISSNQISLSGTTIGKMLSSGETIIIISIWVMISYLFVYLTVQLFKQIRDSKKSKLDSDAFGDMDD